MRRSPPDAPSRRPVPVRLGPREHVDLSFDVSRTRDPPQGADRARTCTLELWCSWAGADGAASCPPRARSLTLVHMHHHHRHHFFPGAPLPVVRSRHAVRWQAPKRAQKPEAGVTVLMYDPGEDDEDEASVATVTTPVPLLHAPPTLGGPAGAAARQPALGAADAADEGDLSEVQM